MNKGMTEFSYWRSLRRRCTRRELLAGALAVAAGTGAFALACGGGSNNPKSSAAKSTPAAPGAAFSGPPAKITISVGSTDPTYLIPYLAKSTGIFQRNGLDATIQVIPGPQSVAALIAGQIQFAHAGGGEVLAADASGAEIIVIAAPSPVFPGYVYSASSIKTAADAKGKKAAITSPGGTFDIILRASFQKMGLDPDKDITFIATGSITNALTAMVNGAVQIQAQSIGPGSIQLESLGFNRLYDPADIPIDSAGVNVQKAWLTANRAVAQRYIDSLVQGIVRMKQDKALALDVMRKELDITDEKVLSVTYDYFSKDKITPTLPYAKAELFPAQLAEIAKKNEAAKNFDISKILDQSLVQSAADRHLDKG